MTPVKPEHGAENTGPQDVRPAGQGRQSRRGGAGGVRHRDAELCHSQREAVQLEGALAARRTGRRLACRVLHGEVSVQPVHARASVAAGGYRIRRMAEAPVYVNGKRTGTLLSRVVRPGGYVQVGQTVMCLECGPEGIVNRSHGAVMENDLMWVVRHGSRSLFTTVKKLVMWPLLLAWEVVGTKLGALAVFFLLYSFWPWFHAWVNYFAAWGWAWVRRP